MNDQQNGFSAWGLLSANAERRWTHTMRTTPSARVRRIFPRSILTCSIYKTQKLNFPQKPYMFFTPNLPPR